jgi:hypothetical protein
MFSAVSELLLQWAGPVVQTAVNVSPPLLVGVLHEQAGWRCFIRCGSPSNKLRIYGFRFMRREVAQLLDMPGWHVYLPSAWAKGLRRKKTLTFLRELRPLIRRTPLYVTIGY